MAQELWIIEASFIANGIRYGFEGDRLREYVEKRLRQSEEFEERSARRQECALRTELNEKLKKINERIASSKYEGAKRDLLASRERTPDKAWKTLLTDKQRSEEYSKPVGGSVPRPTGSVQCMATSVGDAQKQLESRPNDVEAQDVEAKDVEAQDVEAQDVEAQDVEAQDVEAQDVEAQDVEAQGLEAQQLEAQELEAQDEEAQGVEDKETRRAILVSTEEVSGETVWNTEIGCVSSGPASAPRGSDPVTVSCVASHSGRLRVLLSGAKASSVTAALVSTIDAEHVGVNVEVKPSGAESTQQRMDKFAITILGRSAVIPVCALVKPTLELDLKCASLQTIAQLAEMVSTGNIPPWPPPQQRMTRSGRVVKAPIVFDL